MTYITPCLDLFRQNVEVCLFQNLVVALNRIRKIEQKKWKWCDQNYLPPPPPLSLSLSHESLPHKRKIFQTDRSSQRRCSVKKGVLKIFRSSHLRRSVKRFRKFHRKIHTYVGVSFLRTLHARAFESGCYDVLHKLQYLAIMRVYFSTMFLRCMHARQPRAASSKTLCPTVLMRMHEIFLSQNKCRVGKVCKNRYLAVDLSNFPSQNKCWVGKVCKNRCPAEDLSNFLSQYICIYIHVYIYIYIYI